MCVCMCALPPDESVFDCDIRCSGTRGGPAVGTLERGEAAGERCLQLGGQEDAQLGDDAARDELVRGHVERRVPHLHACGQDRGERSNAAAWGGVVIAALHCPNF